MVCDVSGAYCYAPSIHAVYVKMVEEDLQEGDEDTCGRFNVPMYGVRDVAFNLREHYKQHVLGFGFHQGRASPCLFCHPTCGINVFIHGGHYVVSGVGAESKCFASRMQEHYECKVQIIGLAEGDGKSVEVLNRTMM